MYGDLHYAILSLFNTVILPLAYTTTSRSLAYATTVLILVPSLYPVPLRTDKAISLRTDLCADIMSTPVSIENERWLPVLKTLNRQAWASFKLEWESYTQKGEGATYMSQNNYTFK